MLKTCSTAAAPRADRRACRACRRPIADPMDAGRHAEMFGQPEHRLHSCRPSVDGVHLHPERANPAAGLLRCAQHDWAQHRHLGGRCVRLGRVGAHGWHTGRSARWRICRRQRGHRPRPWRRRKRPDRGFWAHVCPAARLAGRFGCGRRCPRRFRAQTAAGALKPTNTATPTNVRYWHLADLGLCVANVRF